MAKRQATDAGKLDNVNDIGHRWLQIELHSSPTNAFVSSTLRGGALLTKLYEPARKRKPASNHDNSKVAGLATVALTPACKSVERLERFRVRFKFKKR